jgi:hypothetical protein
MFVKEDRRALLADCCAEISQIRANAGDWTMRNDHVGLKV